ncbi:unnamed protein product [Pleuronectes platessa]|uniref:Uncharacterized protein n=1 Tax=Pleuronectes platessa TaxID=8262 RepID=A0A9N7VC83_PLEPL|nr:unnamed protein product [Pleuronectes platessa]
MGSDEEQERTKEKTGLKERERDRDGRRTCRGEENEPPLERSGERRVVFRADDHVSTALDFSTSPPLAIHKSPSLCLHVGGTYRPGGVHSDDGGPAEQVTPVKGTEIMIQFVLIRAACSTLWAVDMEKNLHCCVIGACMVKTGSDCRDQLD